ncbi:hypothetical protein FP2506_11497 [Fulvimarina pelagi HTCC2506]|uniref:Uncharacterized protein n=1 Tax=Fulvimarina pelagi HTCC2506 TaxID=314231 RepID=Q0FYY0_9HYPH|nr:hypothetical protein [Fulvimarina pelagi]EAU40178.1 hypothetical protein FP2506_11497 [Fulvimarina pelagi HTCC2506]
MQHQPSFADQVWRFLNWLFPDWARSMEYVGVFGLGGWALFLLRHPDVLQRGSFRGFSALPANVWALLMGATAFVQFVAIVAPKVPGRATFRFVAMALAAGFWAVVAFNFGVSGTPSTGTHMYATWAGLSALAGVWLGCLTIKS